MAPLSAKQTTEGGKNTTLDSLFVFAVSPRLSWPSISANDLGIF